MKYSRSQSLLFHRLSNLALNQQRYHRYVAWLKFYEVLMFFQSLLIRSCVNAQHFVFCISWFVIVVAGVFGCHHFCGWKWHRGNGNVNANNVAIGSSKTELWIKKKCSILYNSKFHSYFTCAYGLVYIFQFHTTLKLVYLVCSFILRLYMMNMMWHTIL